jgi:hypothetical protein
LYGLDVVELEYISYQGNMKYDFEVWFEHFMCQTLLEILLFATSHYATGMQLVVICNYLGHVCNYKFGIV